MAEEVLEHPQAESFLTDIAGVFDFFIDPRGAARRMPRKFFWIVPVVLVSIVMIGIAVYNMPLVEQAMTNQTPPANVNPDTFRQQMAVGLKIQKVAAYFAPLFLIVFSAISALIVMASCVVIDVKPKFLELFNMFAGLSVIEALRYVAITVILHARGEPSGLADLQPPLGLDIFAPLGTNKILVSLLGYINVFQIWEIVMPILIFAAAYKVKKGKAAAALIPLFVIGLLLRLVGALFART